MKSLRAALLVRKNSTKNTALLARLAALDAQVERAEGVNVSVSGLMTKSNHLGDVVKENAQAQTTLKSEMELLTKEINAAFSGANAGQKHAVACALMVTCVPV